MKAIVNVKKTDGRALYNGKTYPVRKMDTVGNFTLNINGDSFAFSAKEVIIVDIVIEAKRAFKFRDEPNGEMGQRYYGVQSYIKANNIKIPPYNMLDCKDIEWEPLTI